MSVVDLFQQIAENDFGFFQQVNSVRDIMVSNPPTLTLDDTYQDAQRLFKSEGTLHAPVVNPDDQSVGGILSDRDLLRFHPRLLGKAAERDEDHRVLKTPVSNMMTRQLVLCRQSASPVEAMSLMIDHHIDSVVVYEDETDELAGIVTPQKLLHTLLIYHRVCTRDPDLKRLRLVDLDFRNGIPLDEIFARGAQTVRDVMTKTVTSINADQSIGEAMDIMQSEEFRHLPVTKSDGTVIGMLSDRDILKYLPSPKTRTETETRFREALFATDEAPIRSTPVEKVMNKKAASVDPETLLTDAIRAFDSSTVAGLSVVSSGSNELVGILTTTDILRVFRVVMQLGHGRPRE